jgi:tripartite-type tricarboxylate transporter receptor subunit TctC
MKQLLTVIFLGWAMLAQAQTFPSSKPIAIVVPFAAGGPTDKVARDLALAMGKALPGANFVVENTVGAGGTIGTTRVAKAAPDGHTLLLFHIGMATTPALYRKLQYKPLEDFEYLGLVNEVPMTLVGKPQLPANTYRDFENYMRANPGKLNLAHAGLGSASHTCAVMWQDAIKLEKRLVEIPYSGTAPALNALVAGQVDVLCDQTNNTIPQIEGGRAKAFAVTTLKPLSSNKVLKYYPTLDEMGLRGFNLTIWNGMYAPKGTPAPVLALLNKALRAAMVDPDFVRKQEEQGAVMVTDGRATPEGHKAFVVAETAKLKPAIEAAKQFAD